MSETSTGVSEHRFDDPLALAAAAADAVVDALNLRLADAPGTVLAVPGGSTARSVLPVLARRPIAWERVCVTLVDERWVPPGHPDSNEALVRACLGPAAGARILGLYSGAPSPEAALDDLNAHMPAPDVILLGMGEDGHIASLFPGDAANQAEGKYVAVHRSDHARVTLTPPAIAAARTVVLAFSGAIKESVFRRARADGPAASLPVRHALRAGAEVFIGA
jgi:6-phosphogluconolactonase